MKLSSYARLFMLPVFVLGLAACGDDGNGNGTVGPTGPFDLEFTGDASFQGAHGGQEIHVVVEASDGEVVASETSTVAADQDPAFSFTFEGILEEGEGYAVKYWIDSNFDGGTEGVCGPPDDDHQWRVDISSVDGDETISETHQPGETESVCEAFAFDLEFTGDDSFQNAHGGQTIHVKVVRSGSGISGGDLVVATETGTVSSSEDPSFAFNFPGILARDMEYDLEYWIDSNFGGGTEGTCDAPDVDHQWRIEFGPVIDDVTQADSHRPTETEAVCSSGSDSEDDPTY